MEDQYGGRTDDDLFYDDFEPVQSETIVVQQAQPPLHLPRPTPASVAPSSAPAEPAQINQSKSKKSSPSAHNSANNAPLTSAPQSQPPLQVKGGNLSSSRFAREGNFHMKQQSTPPAPAENTSPSLTKGAKDKPKDKETGSKAKDDASATPPPNAPTAPAKEKNSHGSQNTAANPEARLGSGANPRQKLTDAELAAKMEQMKLLSAEKTRKFERAEKDEKQHAEAYAKGMEEARKRRADEAERRRRGEENQRRLDDERAKNRERKLKAMGMKEGGWDEGKEAILEEEARRGFRGANGGIRGTKRGGLSGSRYAREGEELPDVDRFLDERHRGRGRGRGERRGGRGRGGRGGFDGLASKPTNSKSPAPALTTEEFPALPSYGSKKPTAATAVPVYPPSRTEAVFIPSLSTPPPSGSKWDDEMEALDELQKQGQS